MSMHLSLLYVVFRFSWNAFVFLVCFHDIFIIKTYHGTYALEDGNIWVVWGWCCNQVAHSDLFQHGWDTINQHCCPHILSWKSSETAFKSQTQITHEAGSTPRTVCRPSSLWRSLELTYFAFARYCRDHRWARAHGEIDQVFAYTVNCCQQLRKSNQ